MFCLAEELSKFRDDWQYAVILWDIWWSGTHRERNQQTILPSGELLSRAHFLSLLSV